MRFGLDGPWLVAVALCGCAAMGIGAYGIGAGVMSPTLLASAIIVLGLGLIMAQARAYFRSGTIEDIEQDLVTIARRVDTAEQHARDWQFGQEGLSQQITALRADTGLAATQLTQGLEEIRRSHVSIAEQIQSILGQPLPSLPKHELNLGNQPPRYSPRSDYGFQTEVPDIAPAPSRTTDKLTLALEPIIDLYTMQTAHYRIIVSMLNDQGQEVAPETFMLHASHTGERAEIDYFVIREALGLLGTLRQRDPNLCVITSVGAETLSDNATLRAILDLMLEKRNVSAGLVIEISHVVLAGLSQQAVEGLALLARAGVSLALASASIAGADLGALSKLNMRYVSLAASSIGAGLQASAALGGFVQAARALRVQIVITQVAEARQMQEISRTVRYAAGPAFANPRRLRREDQPEELPSLRAVA
jgi:EAL domain-containing protein (putative c-di-GMP-specific phosphodiesterase class I)